jgi:phage repressor protein C with HTH and peptisase S24 domain
MEFAPNINKDWLLTGEGEMLKVPATLTVYNPTHEEHQEMGSNIDMSIVPAQVVEEIKAEVVEEIREEIAVPILPSDVANCPDMNIRKYAEDNSAELEHFDPSVMTANVDLAEKIRKTSMLPTFAPNDIVFIKFLKDKTKIIDGHIYYFDTKTRPTMIRKVKFDPDGRLRLIAQNPSFGDIVTTFDDIQNVATIEGLFRMSFGDQYSEIEEVRRKKDAQVDSLINEVSKAGERVDKMMEQMTTLVKHAIEKR